ncbi:MAG TPA: TerB family tellurite resistance protein [Bacteroidales bacterium]|nr:TerB family tellurite resistance protein [Bacteroidales bacterium]
MKKISKWIGAGLGWTLGGPIGAILGFAFGSYVDNSDPDTYYRKETKTTTGDFVVSLLVLIAAVMKADQRIMKSELDYVKNHLTRYFGAEEAANQILMLRDIIKQDIPVRDVTRQIHSKMDYPSRLQLMHLIYGIALADGTISESETIQLEQIGADLEISQADLNSLKNMFVKTTDWAYNVLEVSPSNTTEEIKTKYRQMALKNHPDKVAYLGEEVRKQAESKFVKIQEAWDAIKKERNIN